MIPIFIGYDTREIVAWHVLAHSIVSRSSEPVALTPVGMTTLPQQLWWREKGPHDSTQFSNARFIVPALMGYQGWAIFMDCDMLCLSDLAGLWAQRDDRYAVMVVKHNHQPRETTKFLGAAQTAYPFKNWSSLMLMNCAHPSCRTLTPEYVNTAPGLDLHGFAWTAPSLIGEIRGLWNVLTIGPEDMQHPDLGYYGPPQHIHYTRGGPWHGVRDVGANRWDEELAAMLASGNPCAAASSTQEGDGLRVVADYAVPATPARPAARAITDEALPVG